MAKQIENPMKLTGDEKQDLQTLYGYLYRLSNTLNENFQGIGNNDLNDEERKIVSGMIAGVTAEDTKAKLDEMQTLKSLIIKTAEFVQTKLQEYRTSLVGEVVAEGKFGKYVRNTKMDVTFTPEGAEQQFTFQQLVTGLHEYEINAKNYIKTGYLHDDSNHLPVYGVAIGKDIVTFAEDGTETYHDGNKVAELTADELSFWQSGSKIASYTGTELAFFISGNKIVSYSASGIKYWQSGNMVAQYTGSGISFFQGGVEIANLTGSALAFKQGGKVVAEFTGSGGISFKQGGVEVANLDAGALTFKQGGNIVAKFEGTEVGFYQNNVKVARFTSGRIAFCDGSTDLFYLDNGKLYSAADIEIAAQKKLTVKTSNNIDEEIGGEGVVISKSGELLTFQMSHIDLKRTDSSGIYYESFTENDVKHGKLILIASLQRGYSTTTGAQLALESTYEVIDGYSVYTGCLYGNDQIYNYDLGKESRYFRNAYIRYINAWEIYTRYIDSKYHQFEITLTNQDNTELRLIFSTTQGSTDIDIQNLNGKIKILNGSFPVHSLGVNADLDDVREDGVYSFDVDTAVHKPTSLQGGMAVLEVINTIQRITKAGNMWVRNSFSGSWYKYSGVME